MKTTSKQTTKPKGSTKPFKLSPEEISEGVEFYLKKCKEESKIPFKQDFCLYMGIAKDTLERYQQFKTYYPAIKRLSLASEQAIINAGISGTKPIMSIFLLKALFGYKEGTTMDITSDGKPIGVVHLPARVK